MGLGNKKFKCKSDFTLYTLGPLQEDGYHNITWTHEDGSKNADKWRGVTVDKKFESGDWYYVEEEPSIARPILEERKVGKIRMELFDTGFPNAVLEIARMMTWANEHKGYKDNDWKVLPDAENAFKGAAARHRVKLDAQRSFGEDLLDCVDEESNITHLAHECFNNLALLELALVGRIK